MDKEATGADPGPDDDAEQKEIGQSGPVVSLTPLNSFSTIPKLLPFILSLQAEDERDGPDSAGLVDGDNLSAGLADVRNVIVWCLVTNCS